MNPGHRPPTRPTAFPDNRFAAYLDDRRADRAYKSNSHYHYGYELLYFLEGTRRININGKVFEAGPGDLALFRPGMAHEEEILPGPYKLICLRFPSDKVDLPLPGEKELPPVIRLPWRVKFQHILEQIIEERAKPDTWSEKMTGAYLMQFVVLLWRALSRLKKEPESTGQDAPQTHLRRLIDLIDREISADLKLSDLAAKAFMSESHFSHTFKTMTGVSPKQYIIDTRIEKACELLKTTEKSATAIADELGFDSPGYFNRLFKKKCRVTPLEYREKAKKVRRKVQ